MDKVYRSLDSLCTVFGVFKTMGNEVIIHGKVNGFYGYYKLVPVEKP